MKFRFAIRECHTNVLGWVPRMFARPRKSLFAEGYNVPDVRLLAPPDAMICAPSDPHFPDGYFDILSCGVILKSLGRSELGPNSKINVLLEPPPLKKKLFLPARPV